MADAPLLGRGDDAEVFLDNPLIEIGHFLVLSLGHFTGGHALAVGIVIAHVHLADTHQFARLGHELEHAGDGGLQIILCVGALIE